MRKIVLLCSHNGARFVREQLVSIIEQSCSVDEIHVFDYASIDATREIVLSVRSLVSAPLIQLHPRDVAPGASLSFFGAMDDLKTQLAPDDCVFLADQDDKWKYNKVGEMCSAFEDASRHCERVAVFHDVEVTDSSLAVQRSSYYVDSPYAVPRDLAVDRLLLCNPVIGHTMAMSGALLMRVVRVASREKYLMHDWACVLFASRHGVIRFVDQRLSFYRQHDRNIIGAFGRNGLRGQISRVRRFARALVVQAVAFAADTDSNVKNRNNDLEYTESPKIDRCVRFLSRRLPSAVGMFLGLIAFCRGPTPKRRMLGLALMLVGSPVRRVDSAVGAKELRLR